VRIALVQNDPEFGRVDDNLAWIRRTALGLEGPDLIVLPELCATGYLFRDRRELAKYAEPLPDGPVCRALGRLARETGAHVCGGIAEAAEGVFFNSAVLLSPEGDCRVYRKVHLFDREKTYFHPGNLPFSVAEVHGARLGVMICFDWIFPESARTLALRGAQVVLHPANLVLPYAFDAMAVRALENRVFTVTVNRTGKERGLVFRGKSVVWSPAAERLLSCPEEPGAWTVELDPGRADDKMATERNHVLEDRRPDMYSS
jgi:predicted amidohydrolase